MWYSVALLPTSRCGKSQNPHSRSRHYYYYFYRDLLRTTTTSIVAKLPVNFFASCAQFRVTFARCRNMPEEHGGSRMELCRWGETPTKPSSILAAFTALLSLFFFEHAERDAKTSVFFLLNNPQGLTCAHTIASEQIGYVIILAEASKPLSRHQLCVRLIHG